MASLRQFTQGLRLHVAIILERVKIFLQLINLKIGALCKLLIYAAKPHQG